MTKTRKSQKLRKTAKTSEPAKPIKPAKTSEPPKEKQTFQERELEILREAVDKIEDNEKKKYCPIAYYIQNYRNFRRFFA